MKQLISKSFVMFVIFGAAAGVLFAQQQPPDIILFNGKIVTMSDHGVNGNVGNIAQAIAVRGTDIVAVGSNAQVQALAGPSTKKYDLKGRTVTPGLAATHDHPQDWDPLNPYLVRKVMTDDVLIERFI